MGFKEFKEKMESDSAFAAKFDGIDNVDKVIELAKAEGYNITANDLKEISDDDLGAVAGGYGGSIYKMRDNCNNTLQAGTGTVNNIIGGDINNIFSF